MPALTLLDITLKCNIFTMFVMFSDELFIAFEALFLFLQGFGMGRKSWEIMHHWFRRMLWNVTLFQSFDYIITLNIKLVYISVLPIHKFHQLCYYFVGLVYQSQYLSCLQQCFIILQ